MRCAGPVESRAPLDAAARRLAGEEASRVAGPLARKYPVRRRSLARLFHGRGAGSWPITSFSPR